MKLKVYPTVIGVVVLGLVALLASRVEFTVVEPGIPPDSSLESELPPVVEQPAVRSPQASSSPTISPSPLPTTPTPTTPTDATPPPAAGASLQQGKLRVSNPTTHPVRVALLPQQPGETDQPGTYQEPVHWDFAPGEGSQKGLILSLPDGVLALQTGDVVVVFAQDGSRQYWGPYVLGQTDAPIWNAETGEWQLTLQP
jgi:hypothetical protein